MNLLVVGFQPRNRMQYPHLKQVLDRLEPIGARYLLFRERGYFLGGHQAGFRSFAAAVHAWYCIVVDSLRLLVARIGNRDAAVLAVDNFAYIVASAMFRNVALWSHDFLTDDVDRSRTFIQRAIKRRVAAAMRDNGAIVIQDRARLELFEETYLEGAPIPQAFLLPVSIAPCGVPDIPEGNEKPVLMQIGGISGARSHSDELLGHFQSNSDHYQLAFNGFVGADMEQAIAQAVVPPLMATVPCPPDEVHTVVRGCDIGFIAYNADNLNFFHVARASGQLAEFLRCGKPVIALGRSSLAAMVETERIGKAIDGFEALTETISDITGDYHGYASRARAAFDSTYNLDRYIPGLIAWLQSRRGP